MLESKIEQIVLDEFRTLFSENEIKDVKFIGSLDVGGIKAIEESGCTSYFMVKVHPRSYTSPTTPECQITIDIDLTVRADVDYSGKTYFDMMEMMLNKLERWQQCMDDVHELFNIDGEYDVCGLQVENGETSIDKASVMFRYGHTFTLFGAIRRY